MRRQAIPQWRALGLVVAALLVAAPVFSAGFGIFEQGTKAMGMASAFAAQGDDPSTLFFNVGGLAFFEEREFALGATYITSTDATWKGTGALEGLEAEQESLSEIPPHFYFVQPLGEKWNFGFSLNAPFGLTTDWKDKDNFPGRFISEMASLTSFDVGA
ncbi:MAG: outer membrane protein transport protein, partial [Thermoanaerobaculia bacterium]